ncbi:MAG: hypothetical protein DWQ34_00685 [Planctomycetota bacterium]|nr:MAG: hypothetical protein DWQ29_00820 [Planctomycetota bacterium]REJ97887.1 MAG: hypothetical protein DWQ34_00685 [Planctomycetota bacterium]REK25641.1 MAG: hypothetical protein DWQ41_11965 [Planctomycetota bacterium]REK31647.1 MAG: hypothetical protein DWQ45_18720 [Planctomycetota bacterium]
MYTFLRDLDRRWIFLLMGIVATVPILAGWRFPEDPSPMVRDVFHAIEDLPDGSRIFMAYDYDPASQGELHPMALAFTRHCALKGHKLYFFTLWPQGGPLIQQNIRLIERNFPDYEYGEDYVNLGYRSGQEGPIKVIVTDLRKSVAVDVNGTSLSEIPMTRDIRNIQQMDLIVNVSAGYPGTKEWVLYASTPYNIETVAGCTGVSAPYLYPYYPEQLAGILGAIKAAAEYEYTLIEEYPQLKDDPTAQEALRRMGPQLVAHVTLIVLIIVGNTIYFVGRSRGDVT